MSENITENRKINCPFCVGELSLIEGSSKAYECSHAVDHKFILRDSFLLWTPTLDADNEENSVFFRKFKVKFEMMTKTPPVKEVFDAETTENLLSVIQTKNDMMREIIAEYQSLGEYVKALEAKLEAHKAASANANVTLFGHPVIGSNKTKSGIILKP